MEQPNPTPRTLHAVPDSFQLWPKLDGDQFSIAAAFGRADRQARIEGRRLFIQGMPDHKVCDPEHIMKRLRRGWTPDVEACSEEDD